MCSYQGNSYPLAYDSCRISYFPTGHLEWDRLWSLVVACDLVHKRESILQEETRFNLGVVDHVISGSGTEHLFLTVISDAAWILRDVPPGSTFGRTCCQAQRPNGPLRGDLIRLKRSNARANRRSIQ